MASTETATKPVVNNVEKERKLRASKGLKLPPSHPTCIHVSIMGLWIFSSLVIY